MHLPKTQRRSGPASPLAAKTSCFSRSVAVIEVLGGLLLLFGFATRWVAMLLSGVMVVAIGTAGIHDHGVVEAFDRSFVDGVLEFVYMPEWFLLLILTWLVFEGAGTSWSVDSYLKQRE